MHVYFEFSQPTDPNIRLSYDKNFDFRAVGGNIKPNLAIKLVIINQKTIKVTYKCKMAAATSELKITGTLPLIHSPMIS